MGASSQLMEKYRRIRGHRSDSIAILRGMGPLSLGVALLQSDLAKACCKANGTS